MNLKQIAKNIRRSIVKMNTRACASHSGSALSIVDILVVLYYKIMNISINNLNDRDRDIFILSKGHASSALYAILSEKGFFDKSLLDKFYLNGGKLPGHLDKDSAPGIEVSSGSLGHGLSIGIGMAIANKTDNINAKIYVMCGDGELNEGSVWEAIMFAPHQNLSNLTLIIDYNKLQGYGSINEVINLEPLYKKFEAFNWDCIEIDGHNLDEIKQAFLKKTNYPKVIIAHTIKGKGVSYMENQFEWHYKSPNEEEFRKAMDELSCENNIY